MHRTWLVLACILGSTGVTRVALSAPTEPISAELELAREVGTETCIDATILEREVERRLGRKLFRDDRFDAKVTIVISGKAGQWRALVELATPQNEIVGKRELVSAGTRCTELDDPLALVLAIMLDVSKQELVPLSQPEPADTPQTEGPKQPSAPQGAEPTYTPISLPREPARSAPWGYAVGLGGGFSLGRQPGPSPGFQGWMEIEPPRFWAFGLSGSLHPSTSAEVDAAAVDFTSRRIGFFVCPFMFGTGGFRGGACVEYGVGSITASAHGFHLNREETRALPEIGARFLSFFTLTGPLRLVGSLSGFACLERDRFVYRAGSGETLVVFQPGPGALAAEIGLALGSR
jgi:hypothetical protein